MPEGAHVLMLGGGLDVVRGAPQLRSDWLSGQLGSPRVSVLVTAGMGTAVTQSQLADVTIGAPNYEESATWRRVFSPHPALRVHLLPSVGHVELLADLSHVGALIVGLVRGAGAGGNTQAAMLRIGTRAARAPARRPCAARASSRGAAWRAAPRRALASEWVSRPAPPPPPLPCHRAALGEMSSLCGVLLASPARARRGSVIAEGALVAHTTLLSSGLLADIIGGSWGGAEAAAAEEFARERSPKWRGAGPPSTWEELECRHLGGRRSRAIVLVRALASLARARGAEARFPTLFSAYEVAVLGRPAETLVPSDGAEEAWRALRARRCAHATARGACAVAMAALVGVGVFIGQRALIAYALPLERFRAGADRTVELSASFAAVLCTHSCLRWGLFGLSPPSAGPVLRLAAALGGGLWCAHRTSLAVKEQLGAEPALGWVLLAPLWAVLTFRWLVEPYSRMKAVDFLLAYGSP